MEHKMVNGEAVPLSAEDIAQREEDAAAWKIEKNERESLKASNELKIMAQEDLIQKHIAKLEASGTPEQKAKIQELKSKQQ